MATTTVLTLEQADAWRAWLDAAPFGDVYHHPAYVAPLAARGEGAPLLFTYRDGDAAAFHVVLRRPLRDLPFAHPYADKFDAVSPYGYAGPVTNEPAIAAPFWQAWSTAARAHGIVAEFVRFHPLLRNHETFASCLAVRPVNPTIWMDLTGEVEAGLSKSRRRDARWAERQGVVVERVGRDFLPQFAALYNETMRRRAAEPYYFFAVDYFFQLADGLGDDFWLLRAHQHERDCAYALCLRHRETLHYHLSCSDEATAETRATTLLLVDAARAGRAAGCRRFHLGGGYRGQDSLFNFKAHFSAERAQFCVGTAVHDARVVDELAALAQRAGAAPADPQFFPPYRSRR